MTNLTSLIARHGYAIVMVIVFAEAIGLPVPAALALVVAGAATAGHILRAEILVPATLLVMVLGDTLLFSAGRYSGWALLGFLCKVSANPETCILRSAEYFYRRGKLTLLFAKFIPGINTMSPPLAGSMRMRPAQFLTFDSLGAAIYISSYAAVGYVFSDALRAITRGSRPSRAAITCAWMAVGGSAKTSFFMGRPANGT